MAALWDQIAAISTIHRHDPIQPLPNPPVLGSAAMTQLCLQAAALQPLGRHRPASVQPAPLPPVVGSAGVAGLHTQVAGMQPMPA